MGTVEYLSAAEPVINDPTHSQILWNKIRAAENRLNSSGDRFWNHPNLVELYPQFLIQMHHTMLGGLGLMDFAALRAKAMPHDPVAQIVAPYLTRHLAEEQDHIEWVLADLAVLGVDAKTVRGTAPAAQVVSLIGGQYYWINAGHPVALFGYLILLEGFAPIPHQLDSIMERTGLPSSSFSCLRGHAEDDPSHLADLNHILDSMPLTAEQTKRVGLSMFNTVDTVSSLLDDLSTQAS